MFAISTLAIIKALNVFKPVRFSNNNQRMFSNNDHDIKGVHGHYISPVKLNKALLHRNMEQLPIVKPQFLAVCSLSFLKGTHTTYSMYNAMKIKNFALYTLEDSSVPFIEIRLDKNTVMCIHERKRPKKDSIMEAVKMLELLKKTEVENIDYVVLPEIDFKAIEKCDWVRGILTGTKELNHILCYNRLSILSKKELVHYKSHFHYTIKNPFMFYIKHEDIEDPLLMGYINHDSWVRKEKI